jgi:hemerythrin-like metal-binding protein
MTTPSFDKYLLGLPEIDDEHKMLFNLLVETVDHISQGRYSVAHVTLEVLHDMFGYHCAMEEALMKRWKCPYISEHSAEHARLKGLMLSAMSTIIQNTAAPTQRTSMILIVTLENILLDHIKNYDTRVAAFIKVQMANDEFHLV